MVLVGGKADFIIKDREGNIKHDTRGERIRDRQAIAALAAKHLAHPVARAILRRYRAAAAEPEIEFILYESVMLSRSIFAASTRHGGHSTYHQAIGGA
jgi:hypothetical protein